MSSLAHLNNHRYHVATYTLPTPPPVLYLSYGWMILLTFARLERKLWYLEVKVHTSQLAWKILDLCGADANKLAYFPEERAIYIYVTICLSGKIFIHLIWWINGCDIHLAYDVSVTGTLYSQNNGFRSCTVAQFERFLSKGFCSKLNWCKVANLTFIFLPRKDLGYSNLAADSVTHTSPTWPLSIRTGNVHMSGQVLRTFQHYFRD